MAVDVFPMLAYAPAAIGAIPSLLPLAPVLFLSAALVFGVTP